MLTPVINTDAWAQIGCFKIGALGDKIGWYAGVGRIAGCWVVLGSAEVIIDQWEIEAPGVF